ncbi:MAG: hypothetical protein ACLTZM_08515 [Ruminococcus sp.]
MFLVIAEKPSVSQAIAKVIGAYKSEDGYLSGRECLVSWCLGHLAEYVSPEAMIPDTVSGSMGICRSSAKVGACRFSG